MLLLRTVPTWAPLHRMLLHWMPVLRMWLALTPRIGCCCCGRGCQRMMRTLMRKLRTLQLLPVACGACRREEADVGRAMVLRT